jgi:ElaB/YqjD/DUF883 family membrane-anchored ribosome-binding protein
MEAKEREEFGSVLETEEQVNQLEEVVAEKGREWLMTADDWVRRNPYLAMGIAVAAGCAIIALLRREDD